MESNNEKRVRSLQVATRRDDPLPLGGDFQKQWFATRQASHFVFRNASRCFTKPSKLARLASTREQFASRGTRRATRAPRCTQPATRLSLWRVKRLPYCLNLKAHVCRPQKNISRKQKKRPRTTMRRNKPAPRTQEACARQKRRDANTISVSDIIPSWRAPLLLRAALLIAVISVILRNIIRCILSKSTVDRAPCMLMRSTQKNMAKTCTYLKCKCFLE